MSEPFQTTQQNVSRHAKNISEDGDLVEYPTASRERVPIFFMRETLRPDRSNH
jgi:hypothetical protein